jgi:hypothetical protein
LNYSPGSTPMPLLLRLASTSSLISMTRLSTFSAQIEIGFGIGLYNEAA